MVEMKEKRLEQQRDLCLVQPTETLKETSLACLKDDLMAMQMVLKTEIHLGLRTVQSSDLLMEIQMALSLVHLLALLTALQMVLMMVMYLVYLTEIWLAQLKAKLKELSLACLRDHSMVMQMAHLMAIHSGHLMEMSWVYLKD